MGISDEQNERLTELLSNLKSELDSLYPGARNFVQDQIKRHEQYGQNIFISPKQWKWLSDLEKEFVLGSDGVEAADERIDRTTRGREPPRRQRDTQQEDVDEDPSLNTDTPRRAIPKKAAKKATRQGEQPKMKDVTAGGSHKLVDTDSENPAPPGEIDDEVSH